MVHLEEALKSYISFLEQHEQRLYLSELFVFVKGHLSAKHAERDFSVNEVLFTLRKIQNYKGYRQLNDSSKVLIQRLDSMINRYQELTRRPWVSALDELDLVDFQRIGVICR